MKRLYLLLAVLLFAVLLTGCGGSVDRSGSPALPASHGNDEFRPNFLGDLKDAYFWETPVVTYRIVTSAATDHRGQPISCTVPTPEQAKAVRDAIGEWAGALQGLRTFEEVDGGADIDIVIQDPQAMPQGEEGDDPLGRTDYWIPNGFSSPALGRAAVRLRSDLSGGDLEETTRHEFGHAIGFWGHSRHIGDVMYPRKLWFVRVKGLSEYDVNSARANYTR